MPQQELFNPDEVLKLTTSDYQEAMERLKITGRQQGDAITDQIMAKAAHIIRVKLRAMSVDIEAEARAARMDVDDYIEELDAFYELTSYLTRAYLEGMETALPFPIFD